MPEPPCFRITKFKEAEIIGVYINLTVILDPQSSNAKPAALNDHTSACQEPNMQESAKKRSEETERNFA